MSGPEANLPERVVARLHTLDSEIHRVISAAAALLTNALPESISLSFANSAPTDILTNYERAQSVSFITRFELLPSDCTVQIASHGGKHYIENLALLRHTLNDFRPLIWNQRDSTYYQTVHSVWRRMLTFDDPKDGTVIRAMTPEGDDVTPVLVAYLEDRCRSIRACLKPLEFDYLYNGVLQHSDESYSARLLDDYCSGELNYLFWKHAQVLNFIRELLHPYYQTMRCLTFPAFGGL